MSKFDVNSEFDSLLPKREKKIRLFQPSITSSDLDDLTECFDKAWLGLGEKVYEFEQLWSQRFECKHAIACNSATAALHISLQLHDFPKGSEVIVPSLTFVSSASVILFCQLKPVFVDVCADSLTLDVKQLEDRITANTVAILPVHYGGEPCDMQSIMEIAIRHNLIVIEDCAHTQGGLIKDKYLGTWGDLGCFSFEEKKGMTTGDGGMIVTNNDQFASLARKYRWLGIDKDTWSRDHSKELNYWYYEISHLGYKYNMNNLAASIGIGQLKKLDHINEKKNIALMRFLDALKFCKSISPLLPYSTLERNKSSYWLFGVRTEHRNELMSFLMKHNISYGMHFTPLNEQPLFDSYVKNTTPIASEISNKILTLPLHAELTEEEIDYICKALVLFDSRYSYND